VDQARADVYRLLSRVLGAPADRPTLDAVGRLIGDGSPLGAAIDRLAEAARRASAGSAADEYQRLFIGLGRGILVPYGSYYLTGFMHEKPLARLRVDMAALGVERDPAIREPEDHIAIVCETMAGFVDGAFGARLPLERQRTFFAAHIGSWAHHFFRDLAGVDGAPLYAPVGSVGNAFVALETAAFDFVGIADIAGPERPRWTGSRTG
jgi:TorA maturation chaperone TorD